MADPISLTAIAGVLTGIVEVGGAVITILGILLSVFEFGAIILYFIIKIIVTVIINFAYAIGMTILTIFNGVFGWVVFKTSIFAKEIQTDKFDDKPQKRQVDTSKIGIVTIATQMFEEIRTILEDLFIFITPLLAAFPYILILAVIFYGIAALMIPFTTPFFVLIDTMWSTLIVALEFLEILLNAAEDLRAGFAPIVNGIIGFTIEFFYVLLKISCPGVPYTGEFSHDCPILYMLWVYFQTGLDAIWTLIELSWSLFLDGLIALGNIVCPGGVCPTTTCQQLLGRSICSWTLLDPELIVRYMLYLFQLIVIGLVQVVFIQVYFVIDIIKGFVFAFGGIFGRYISPSLYASLTSSISNYPSLTVFTVSSEYVGLKNFYLFFEGIASIFFYVLSNLLNSGISMLDALLCNIFIEPIHCAGYKLCYTFFKPITLVIIPKVLTYTLDLNTALCTNILHIDWNICQYKCDRCAFKPFGISLDLAFWYRANQYYATSGASFGPCDLLSGCCAGSYSILQKLFP
jgi:hypothetical protein